MSQTMFDNKCKVLLTSSVQKDGFITDRQTDICYSLIAFLTEIDEKSFPFQVKGSLIVQKTRPYGFTDLDITFDQTVTVTESSFPSLSLSTLMAQVGGSLGLWLGLGIIQICVHFIDAVSFIKNKAL